MIAKIRNNRLLISILLSVLMHLLVFVSLSILLQFKANTAVDNNTSKLEVRMVLPRPQPITDKKLLGITTSTPFTMAQLPLQQPPAIASPPTAPADEQAIESAELQAQILLQQLQQLLSKMLDAEPALTGKCVLIETEEGPNNRFKCDNGTLYEVISVKQKDIAAMMMALRGTGRSYNGFVVVNPKEKAGIQLINEQ